VIVSTVLEAAREAEKGGSATALRLQPGAPAKRRWRAIGAVLLAVATGGAATALFLRVQTPSVSPTGPPGAWPGEAEPTAGAVAVDPTRRVAGAPAALPAAARTVDDERPWARVHAGKPHPADPPVPSREARPQRQAQPASAAVVVPGAPPVALQSISCPSGGRSCSADLLVDGRPVRLRTGESFGQIEVQLVLPDAVYVRHGGTVVALPARR
jgi:hypothetical protein